MRNPGRELVEIAKRWEREHVIPHCAVCARPCCTLETVVLELDWRQAKELYSITTSRKRFDAHLPPHIKTQGGRYYAHGSPCPAYDVGSKKCLVYGTKTKPPSCSEFPIYEDGDAITVDTRCEAIDLDAIEEALAGTCSTRASGLGRIVRERDEQFPVLVRFTHVSVGRRLRLRPDGKKRIKRRSR